MQQNSFNWREKLKAFKIPILILTTVLIVTSCNAFMQGSAHNFYLDILPEKLEVLNVKDQYDCFFAIYDLSPKTIDAINQQGISFFKDQIKSRTSNQFYPYNSYEAWLKTPIRDPDKDRSFGSSFAYGVQCVERKYEIAFASSIDKSLLEKISLAAYAKYLKGSFYTGSSKGQLVVIPRLGIAVISGDHGFLIN